MRIILVLLCLSLTSCTYASRNSFWIKANELDGKYNFINTAKGKGIRGLLLREMIISTDPKARLPKVPDIKLTEEDENKGGFEVK